MRLLPFLAVLVLLIGGCPPKEVEEPPPPRERDRFDHFAGLMGKVDLFNDELKRLQGEYSNRPSLAGIPLGDADNEYAVSGRCDSTSAGLVLLDSLSGEEWYLEFWNAGGEETTVEVVREQETSGGFQYELSIGRTLAVNIRASWVQGRYLQVSREFTLGGLDLDIRGSAEMVGWTLHGPELPYRMVASPNGPFGGIGSAPGGHASYPADALIPAVCAYDSIHGVLLGIGDEHPRKLDRSYTLGYGASPEEGLASISYREYDSTEGDYAQPYFVSGLPIREIVVFQPFDIVALGQGGPEELTSLAVLNNMGDFTRAYHFSPDPKKPFWNFSGLHYPDWSKGGGNELMHYVDSFEANLIFLDPPRFWQEPDADESEVEASYKSQFQQEIDAATEIMAIPAVLIDMYARMAPLMGKEAPAPVRLRDPDECAGQLRALTQMAGGSEGLHALFVSPENRLPGTYDEYPLISPDAAEALFILKLNEELKSLGKSQVLVNSGNLNLGLPPLSEMTLRRSEGGVDTSILHRRFAGYLNAALFGAPQVLWHEGTPAELVLLTVPGTTGHMVPHAAQPYDGFEPLATNLALLRRTAGGLNILHHYEPAGSDEQLIAVTPADWESAPAVWVVFYGAGGSVTVDEYNLLTVSWGEVEYWQGTLPVGYWEVEHPNPADIAPGDAVLIKKKPLMQQSFPDADWG